MKLTDATIKAAKPKSKPYGLSSGDNLVLQIRPNGSKWWRFRYRYHSKAKMLSLGTYPEVTLKVARDLRDEAKKLLKQGIDPSQNRQEKKKQATLAIENSFESVARRWWENWRSAYTERHSLAVLRRLEANVFPVIGNKPISSITAPTLLMVIKKIEGRGAVNPARRVLNTCGQIYRFAVGHGLAERNPASDVKPADVLRPTKTTNFARLDKKDVPELLKNIDRYNGSPLTKFALQLIALTFVRTNELISARWEEIELDARLWRIPAERMKKRTPHIVPLSYQAVAVLQNVRNITGGISLLFPNERNNNKPMGGNTLLYAIYNMGYRGQMTTHGFRGIASTILNEKGYPAKYIELQLAHLTGNAVSRADDRAQHLSERIKMMQDWADYIDALKCELRADS